MWNAAATGDRRNSLRIGWIGVLVALVLLPAVASGGNGNDNRAPKPPAEITVVGASTVSLTFSWQEPKGRSARVGVDGYTIYKDTNVAGKDPTVIGTTPDTHYTIQDLTCGTNYMFGFDSYDAAGNHSDRVSAQGATAACLPSPTVRTPTPEPPSSDTQSPTQPGSLAVADAGETSIAVMWQASSDNVGVTGYALFRNDQQVGTTTARSYSFTGLACGTAYTLGLTAFDAAGNVSTKAQLNGSTSSCPIGSDTTPPTAPSSLTKTGAAATAISISWAPSTDNVAVAGYTVLSNGASIGTTTGTSYTVGGLQCGTSATLGVLAFDAAGNKSSVSQLTASTIACTTPPAGNALYVSPSGSDSNAGTLAAPWRTIGKAAATLTAGQTVYLRAGTYEENTSGPCDTSYNVVRFLRSGSSGAPITISGYPGEESQVIVKTKLRIAANWIRLQNFVYDRNHAYASPSDLACTGEELHVTGDDVTITGLEVRNGNKSGIFLRDADRVTIEGNWIHDNGTHYNADHGIYWSSGAGGMIANNIVEHNYAYGIHMYPEPMGQVITENTVVGNGRSGIILSGAQNVTVVNNISAWNQFAGIRTGSLGCSGCRAERNILFGNASDYELPTPLTIISTIHADPLFVNRSGGNYRLGAGSPAVDAALPQYARADDFEGTARPVGVGPDIGAFERRP